MNNKFSCCVQTYSKKTALCMAVACILAVGSALYMQPAQAEASDHHNVYSAQIQQSILAPDAIANNIAASLNVSASEVCFQKIDLEHRDHDDSYQYPEFYYKVRCSQGNTGHYYIVDARNGQIIRSEASSSYGVPTQGFLAPADLMAKVAAALNVGIKDLFFTKIDLEHRDHDDYYKYPEFYFEVKCTQGNTRYEYKLDAQNGQILKREAKTSNW